MLADLESSGADRIGAVACSTYGAAWGVLYLGCDEIGTCPAFAGW